MEIGASDLPLAPDGSLGEASHRGDLVEGKSAEELEIDEIGQRRVAFRQGVERLGDLAQITFVDELAPPSVSSVVISN